jgi:hypothetical protein
MLFLLSFFFFFGTYTLLRKTATLSSCSVPCNWGQVSNTYTHIAFYQFPYRSHREKVEHTRSEQLQYSWQEETGLLQVKYPAQASTLDNRGDLTSRHPPPQNNLKWDLKAGPSTTQYLPAEEQMCKCKCNTHTHTHSLHDGLSCIEEGARTRLNLPPFAQPQINTVSIKTNRRAPQMTLLLNSTSLSSLWTEARCHSILWDVLSPNLMC